LCPKWYKSKKGVVKSTGMEETMVEKVFNMDETMACTTLQQPKASGERNSLF
jgi:hypothetical protein